MKNPLLNEIRPFYNSVNMYSSNSGHTVENQSIQTPESDHFFLPSSQETAILPTHPAIFIYNLKREKEIVFQMHFFS